MTNKLTDLIERAEEPALTARTVSEAFSFHSVQHFGQWCDGLKPSLKAGPRATRWSLNSALALGVTRSAASRLRLRQEERVPLFDCIRSKVIVDAIRLVEEGQTVYLGLKFVEEGYEVHVAKNGPPPVEEGAAWFVLNVGPVLEHLKGILAMEVAKEFKRLREVPPATRKRFPVAVEEASA